MTVGISDPNPYQFEAPTGSSLYTPEQLASMTGPQRSAVNAGIWYGGMPVPTYGNWTPPAGGYVTTAGMSLADLLSSGGDTSTFWRATQSANELNWEDTGYGAWTPERLAGLSPEEQQRVWDELVNTPSAGGGLLGDVTGPLRDVASSTLSAIGDNPWVIPLLGVGLGAAGIGSASGTAFGVGGSGATTAATTTAATTGASTTGAASSALAPVSLPNYSAIAPTLSSMASGGAGMSSWITPVIQGGLSLFGGKMASDAASDAVAAQERATDRAYDYLEESRDIALERAEPFYQTALSSLDKLNALNAGEYDITQDPSYQFRLDEGMRAIENSAFARGTGMSGGTVRRALRYAQDYASTEYDRIYRRLAETAGFATVQPAGNAIDQSYGSNAANLAINAGEARGSGYIASGNAWQNALDQIAMIDWSKLRTA